jgi:hypothetical protein
MPAQVEQKQNGGNQRPGVADSDPPHKIRNVETPHRRRAIAPNAHALVQQNRHRPQEQEQQRESHPKPGHPEERGLPGQHHGGDLVRDRPKRIPRRDDWWGML